MRVCWKSLIYHILKTVLPNIMQCVLPNTILKKCPSEHYAPNMQVMKMAIGKNIHNLSQSSPNPGFMQEKYKKDSRELKFLFSFRFLWISWRAGTLYWERVFFWLSNNLFSPCYSCSKQQKKSVRKMRYLKNVLVIEKNYFPKNQR